MGPKPAVDYHPGKPCGHRRRRAFAFPMLTDTIYYLFLVPLVVGYRFARGWVRPLILSLAGIAFYYYYAGNALWLLLGLTAGTWFLLFGLKTPESGRGRAIRYGSVAVIVLSVGVLLHFKYSGFLRSVFMQELPRHVFAPLAISVLYV